MSHSETSAGDSHLDDRAAEGLTIAQEILTQAKRYPRAVALVSPDRGALTYSGLATRIEVGTRELSEQGLGRNDRVAIVLPNGPEMAVAFLTVASVATGAPLNPGYGPDEFEFYLGDLNARALILQAGIDSPARAIARRCGIPVIELLPRPGAQAGVFDLEGPGRFAPVPQVAHRPEDTALVLHTSGTTARPKIVPLTHRNLCISAHSIRRAFTLASEDCCLNVMPLYHIHGLVAAVLSSLVSGASVVCTPGFDAVRFYDWLEQYAPTWYTAVPTMHQALLKQAPSHARIIASHPLRFIRSCSAALPTRVMAELEEVFDAPAVESYGMTEAAHQIASNPLPPMPRKPGSVGLPTGPKVAIMDGAGGILGQGEIGEIVIRGANVTPGYEGSPEANARAFTRGWFRTGDQGRIDGDGYLFITGRIKEVINRGGEKISPREVDDALLEHPDLVQVVTFAMPHPTLGEDVAVAVVLREGVSLTEAEIRRFAFSRLADYKVPSQVLLVAEIPKGPTGKLQRIGLAETFARDLVPEYKAPATAAEAALARIWEEVLGLEKVGAHDNFFALGGDSLLATQVVSRARVSFQIELPLSEIFREPTLASQAAVIEERILDEIESLSDDEARRLIE